MLGRLLRFVLVLLFGWLAFVLGAVAYAKVLGPKPRVSDPDADELDIVATFGPFEFHSVAPSLRGGSVVMMFAGGVLDLRGATLDPAGARIHTLTLFGGGNLVVPDDWRVETRLVGPGGAGDARPDGNPSAGAPTLVLSGVALFGGWGITAAPAGEELATA